MRIEGNIHGRPSRGKTREAKSAYAEARALYDAGAVEAAVEHMARAIAAGAAAPAMRLLYGAALSKLGRLDEGDREFETVIEDDPDSLPAWRNLARNADRREDRKRAVELREKLVDLEPDTEGARWRLANAYVLLEGYGKAREIFQGIVDRDPDHLGARFELITSAAHLCDWSNYDEQLAAVAQCAAMDEPEYLPSPFYVLSWPGADEAAILKIVSAWSKRLKIDGAPFYPDNASRPIERKARGDKLKIGFLSSDFHEHPAMFLMGDMLALHDRSRFEIYAFAHDKDRDTPMRRKAREVFDEFVDVRGQDSRTAAQAIFDRDIDILIDRKGHTRGARPHVLMYRPAPIIVSFLAYPGTTGMDAVDYVIADPITIPEKSRKHFSERIAYMPVTYQPNVVDRDIKSGTTRADWGLPDDAFVYANMNQVYKITPDMFAAWMAILGQVEGSVLWLWARKAVPQKNLRRTAAAHGIDPERLIFANNAKPDAHLARVGLVDVALDTAPYGSHTTGSDALRMGVPLIAFKGETFASRVSASLVNAFGMPELITERIDDYIALAVRLGTDAKYRAHIRDKMAKQRQDSYLFDPARFTRDIEALYEKMWAAYEAGKMDKVLK